jgi:three-Cys-motif partner protein
MSCQVERTEKCFFKGKRPWSKIKDRVLQNYLPPYLSKVSKLGRRIILIDAFAGPGKFEDGQPGSPLIISQMAEKYVAGQYLVFFVNHEHAHHDSLVKLLAPFIKKEQVIPILGTAEDLLANVGSLLTDQTLFLYLDPFALTGWQFSTIEPFLGRDKRYSTEIVINLSVPTMHRLAARKAVAAGRHSQSRVRSFHDRLTKVLGGDYWQEILWDYAQGPDEKAERVLAKYRAKLQGAGATYTGSCPVREKDDSVLKYFITFCSRHPDALVLMNDAMCKAYNEQVHAATCATTVFQNTNWKEGRDLKRLREVVVKAVGEAPGRRRADIWLEITRSHFMCFLASEFKSVVDQLCKDGVMEFIDVKKTGRLNDDALLYPK